MRIALAILPTWSVSTPPLGIASMAGALREAGYEVEVFDLNVELWRACRRPDLDYWDYHHNKLWSQAAAFEERIYPLLRNRLEQSLARIAESKPDLLGFSVFGGSLLTTRKASQFLKKIQPDLKIVYGGPEISQHRLEMENEFAASNLFAAVMGEGEATFLEFLRRLRTGEPLNGCLGLAHRDPSGKVVYEPTRPNIPLNTLPLPSFAGLDVNLYAQPKLPVMMSRGCTAKCTFCGETRFWKNYRFREASEIFRELENNRQKYGITKFLMTDSLINGNFKVLSELADLIIASGQKYSWGGYARVDKRMTPDLLSRLRAAGLGHLNFGLETGSQKIMDLMEKRTTVETASEVIRNAHSLGISVILNILVGFPGETEQDFQKTLDFLADHIEAIEIVSTGDTLAIIHGTPLESNPAAFGIRAGEDGRPLLDEHGNWVSDDEDGENTYEIRVERLARLRRFLDQYDHIVWVPGGAKKKRPDSFFREHVNKINLQPNKENGPPPWPEHLHWKFGEWSYSSPARAQSTDFQLSFLPARLETSGPFRDELYRACQKIAARSQGKRLALCHGGGVGSEALAWAFRELGFDFTLYSLDIWGINRAALELHVLPLAEKIEKTPAMVRLERTHFFMRHAKKTFAELGLAYPQHLAMTYLFENIPADEFIVTGAGQLNRYPQQFSSPNLESEGTVKNKFAIPYSPAEVLYYLWAHENHRAGEYYFYQSSPELLASILRHEKYEAAWTQSNMRELIYEAFPVISRRPPSSNWDGFSWNEYLRIRKWLQGLERDPWSIYSRKSRSSAVDLSALLPRSH